MSKCTGDLMM